MAVRLEGSDQAVVLERTEQSSGMLVNLRVRALEDDDHVRVSLAGIIAHRLAVGRWHRQQFSRAHDDLASVAEFYRRRGDTASLRYNIDRVHEILRARWGAVERIATELLRAKRLAFTAVEEIAGAAPLPATVPKAVRPADWPRLVGAVEHHLNPPPW